MKFRPPFIDSIGKDLSFYRISLCREQELIPHTALALFWGRAMAEKTSIINIERNGTLPKKDRRIIRACENTSHECTMDNLRGCLEHIPEPLALNAALVGVFSALCRIIAKTEHPEAMAGALAAMMKSEVKFWDNLENL